VNVRKLIEEVASEIMAQAEELGCELSLKEVGEEGFLICNDSNKKIAALGAVYIKEDKGKKERVVGAFSINIHKYHWAEAEGFTEKQMIEQLNNEIFTLMGVDEVVDYLCPWPEQSDSK